MRDSLTDFVEEQDPKLFFAMTGDEVRHALFCRYAEVYDENKDLDAIGSLMSLYARAEAKNITRARDKNQDLLSSSVDQKALRHDYKNNHTEQKTKPRRQDPDFLKFKTFYPERPERDQNWLLAYMLFRRAIKNGASVDAILDGVYRYRDYCFEKRVEPRFVQTAVRFIQQKSWLSSWQSDRRDPNPLPPSAAELKRRAEGRGFKKIDPRGTK